MAYTVAFTKQALKTLQKMPLDVARLVRQKLNDVASDPFTAYPNVTKLQNREGYRLRVGDWRVIYDIQQDKIVLLVLKIALRGEVYR
jgi:mRNA interferase RelE/StbE